MNDNNDPVIPLISTGCVRYTVPSAIHLSKMPDKLKVRFRVGKVVKNCAVDVYCKEENSEKRIKTKKRPVVAPGEMEEILLGREESGFTTAYPHGEGGIDYGGEETNLYRLPSWM